MRTKAGLSLEETQISVECLLLVFNTNLCLMRKTNKKKLTRSSRFLIIYHFLKSKIRNMRNLTENNKSYQNQY